MARVPTTVAENLPYPTSDGRPMAETDLHRDLMFALIKILEAWFAADPLVYVSGNLLVFYVRGNRRRHVSPDVFVVKGVAKRRRDNYLIWQEGKTPNVVIELTSASTRDEDVEKKFRLYQNKLHVSEYFLFDPHGDYLKPNLQGYRLRHGAYARIRPVQNRLPSKELNLHLEQAGSDLRLYDPVTEQWLLAPEEKVRHLETRLLQMEERQLQTEAELMQLRQALEPRRRGTNPQS